MKAAVFQGSGVLHYQEVPVPELKREKDVQVQVEAASICGSDLHILSVPPGQRGDPGTIMGHEFVARVKKTGASVTSVKCGDRVVIEPNIPCGLCSSCRSGHQNLCERAENIGQWRDGGFAEYCVVPEQQLHKIPEEIPAREAALAEPLACVTHGMIQLNPMPFEKVILFGAGAIGLLFLKELSAFGVQHIAVCETMSSRQEDARRLGAELICAPTDAAEQIHKIWNAPADIIIDAVGVGSILESAVSLIKPHGKILIFGQNMTQQSTISPGLINAKEIQIFATLAVHHSFPPAIQMLPLLSVGDLVTAELPLSRIAEGIQLMREKKAVKVVLYPGT